MTALPDMTAWAVFARVAETGSFSRAATELGLSKGAVSKTVARLEARIGAKLLNRTSRRLSLTEVGRRAAEQASAMLAQAVRLERSASAEAGEMVGLVRMAAPMSFGVSHVAGLLPDLMQTYPGLTIDLHLSDDVSDVTGGGYDFALRIAALADSSMRAKRICQVKRVLAGAPAYLAAHGRPSHPQDLQQHACLGYAYLATADRWRFVSDGGEEATVKVAGPLRANNGDALRPALLAGVGLCVLPEFMLRDDLAAGRLEVLMPGWSLPLVALNVLTPPGTTRAARVSVVIDYLATRLSRPDALATGA
jgi:DNA-binding transcriptional LysR family regulator